MRKLILTIGLSVNIFLSYGQTKIQLNVYNICTNYFCAREMLMQAFQNESEMGKLSFQQSAYSYVSKAKANLESIRSKLSKADYDNIQEAIKVMGKISTENLITGESDGHKAATALVVMEMVNNRMLAATPKLFQIK